MAIYDFFLSRNNAASTPENYVGHTGRLFYDSATGVIKLSDGVTPGGLSIPYTIATTTVLGGVKLGPGVTTNVDGQIIIDSTGLDFSFGNFAALTASYPADYFEPSRQNQEYAVLSSLNTNEDIVLASNGTGAVRVVGDFSVRRANGSLIGALEEEPVFRVISDGQVRMLVPGADSTEGAVGIIGGIDGVFQAPVNTGVMLHITGIAGSPGVPSRIYNDAQNAFAAFVARRYNNTAAAPSAVLADEEIMRLSGTAHNGTLIPSTANQRIVYKALGNQTLINSGGSIELWATPVNTTTLGKIATVDSTGITLESGKVFAGNVTVGAGNKLDVTGATVTGLTLGGLNPADVAGTMTGTTIKSTVTGSSLTSVGTLGNLTVTGNVTAGNVIIGTTTYSNLSIASTSLGADFTIGAVGTTGNLIINRTTSHVKDVYVSGNVFVTGETASRNYHGQARNAGTLGAAGTLTIDFATDHNVLVTLTTTATIAFSNITAGHTVTVLVKNATGQNRAVTTGVVGGNTSGGDPVPNVNDGRTGVFVYRTFGTATTDIYCEVNP